MRSPLLPVAAALAAGIYAERWLHLLEPEYLLAAGALLFSAAVALRVGRDIAAVTFALLGTALIGACSMAHWRHAVAPDDIASFAAARSDPEEPVRLTGWIANAETRRGGEDEIYLLRLERVESAQRVRPVSGTIRLNHYRFEKSEPRLGLRYGDRLTVLARLRPIHGFQNPGGFDWEGRARREGVLYYASVKAAELAERLPGRGGSRWMAAVHGLRAALFSRLDALFPVDTPANGLLRAMLLGDRYGLDRRVSEEFQKTGTYHALVVSGLNAGALVAALFLLPGIGRLPQLAATLLAIALVVLYAMLAGQSVPIVRASVMVALYLLARLVFRGGAMLNTVAAAAVLLLAASPADLHDAGFQLSFFAVLLIVAIAAPWIESTSAPYRHAVDELDNADRDMGFAPAQAQFRLELRMLRSALRDNVPGWLFTRGVRAALWAFELFAVALVVQIGFLLPMVIYFQRAGWVSVMANLVIVPLVALVVPLGIATLVIALFSTTLAGLLAIPLHALVATMIAVARWHAALGPASLRVPAPPAWLSAAFVAAALAVAAGLLARRARFVRAGAAALVIAAALITWHPFAPQLPQRELEITALDVGQGDAVVVLAPPAEAGSCPEGCVMLVDTGGLAGGDSATDTGEQIVSSYLWSRGIRRIDVVALTHAHHDHVAGLASVLANFSVGEIWMPAIPGLEPYERLETLARERAIPLRTPVRGETVELGDVSITFLSPGPEYRPGRRAQNNDSLVMRVRFGGRAALLAGDVERKMELELVRNWGAGLLRADWLKAPHHGSKTSNSAEFLEAVRAPYGVISVAANSPFGHPHPETLSRLEAAKVQVFRTDQYGAVTWATDGNRVRVSTFRWDRPRAAMDLW